MTLRELLDADHLAEMIAAKYVKEQDHPALPYRILNYTAAAQYDRVWNDVTRACRGLIYNAETGAIIARPFPKFHNYGEHEDGTLDLYAPVEVTDKLDGSLGILYPDGNGWAIATRGSFTSDQAMRATAVLRDRYADFAPEAGWTYLFEIVYPENRIVVNYGDLDDLILLACVNVATGGVVGPNNYAWPGPLAETFACGTLAEALALPPRENAEGLIVRYLSPDDMPGLMLKVKQDDYVRLHKLVTGLNERTVWEHMRDGGTVADLCAKLPDEFHAWITETAEGLTSSADAIRTAVEAEYRRILDTLPFDHTRKDFALIAARSPHAAFLFTLLDGKDPAPAIWRTLKPSAYRTLLAITEDVA